MIKTYILTQDLNLNIKVKISSLVGNLSSLRTSPAEDDEYNPVAHPSIYELYVVCSIYSNGRKLGIPVATCFKQFSTHAHTKWDEWLTLPIKYRDLTPTSTIVFTVWGIKQSSYTELPSSGPIASAPSATPASNATFTLTPESTQAKPLAGTAMPLFNKQGVLKFGRRNRKLLLWSGVEGDGSVNSTTPFKVKGINDSVDKLDKLLSKNDLRLGGPNEWINKLAHRKMDKVFTKHKRFDSKLNNFPTNPTQRQQLFLVVDFPSWKHPVVYHQKAASGPLPEILPYREKDRIFVLHDLEMTKDNPVELKYAKLARSSRGVADRDLKPKIAERDLINKIINSPKVLTLDNKQLLWRFRYSLVENKRALVKFLRCVDWADPKEVKQAVDLMEEWESIDVADALELLSPSFRNQEVRSYGVRQLARADDDDFGSVLPQLTQALRYEAAYPSALSKFLIQKCSKSFELSNFFHWYIATEKYDRAKGDLYSQLDVDFTAVLLKDPTTAEWPNMFKRQGELKRNLTELAERASKGNKVVQKKVERMRQLIGDEMKELKKFPEKISLPIKPDVFVTGMIAEESTMFKSALAPMLVGFNTPSGDIYKTIYKSGDDLRQDQLIIQMINLMDSLLKKVKLDLQLTPYRVLATSPEDGFVEFVANSMTLQSILQKYSKSISRFLDEHNPKPSEKQRALNNFVRSCAGYCVITYILGIGDRHLENLLVTTSGQLFHIDFGFIFGRDPKPLPPPIKFNREMIEGMGGANSAGYKEFKRLTALAFNILRKHANLILNLLTLMADANIPDLSNDVEKNLLKVQEKFRLDLDDEEAEQFILRLVDECSRAVVAAVMDKVHEVAVSFR